MTDAIQAAARAHPRRRRDPGTPWPFGAASRLVLIPDVRGLYGHYRDVTRRFAAEGFFTFAIDLYGRGARAADRVRVRSASRSPRAGDLTEAVDFVASRPKSAVAPSASPASAGRTVRHLGSLHGAAPSARQLVRHASPAGNDERKPASPLQSAAPSVLPRLSERRMESSRWRCGRATPSAASTRLEMSTYPSAGRLLQRYPAGCLSRRRRGRRLAERRRFCDRLKRVHREEPDVSSPPGAASQHDDRAPVSGPLPGTWVHLG
jgi:hypothetical protein